MTSFRLTGLPLAGLRLAGPLAPAACVWLLLSGSAHAQLSFHALGEDTLSVGDFSALIDAGNALLRRPNLARGASQDWTNGQSGTKGTITVTDSFRHDGWACHSLLYHTVLQGGPTSSDARLKWCNTPGGWKILS
jgi:hypothetical protein